MHVSHIVVELCYTECKRKYPFWTGDNVAFLVSVTIYNF